MRLGVHIPSSHRHSPSNRLHPPRLPIIPYNTTFPLPTQQIVRTAVNWFCSRHAHAYYTMSGGAGGDNERVLLRFVCGAGNNSKQTSEPGGTVRLLRDAIPGYLMRVNVVFETPNEGVEVYVVCRKSSVSDAAVADATGQVFIPTLVGGLSGMDTGMGTGMGGGAGVAIAPLLATVISGETYQQTDVQREVAESVAWVPFKIQSALQSDWSNLLIDIEKAVRWSRRGDPAVDLDDLYSRSSWEWLDLKDSAGRYERLVRAGAVRQKGRGGISGTYASLLAGFKDGIEALSTAMLLASTSARDPDPGPDPGPDSEEEEEEEEVVEVTPRASEGTEVAEGSGGESRGSWACPHCTFCNPNAQHLACGACYQPRQPD